MTDLPQALQILNSVLNVLVIPALWLLFGIKTELARLCERLAGFEKRLEDTKAIVLQTQIAATAATTAAAAASATAAAAIIHKTVIPNKGE